MRCRAVSATVLILGAANGPVGAQARFWQVLRAPTHTDSKWLQVVTNIDAKSAFEKAIGSYAYVVT